MRLPCDTMPGYDIRVATVRQTKAGTYEVRWYERGPTGEMRRRTKTVKAATLREAKAKAALLEVAEREQASNYTVRHALAEVLRHGGRRTAKSNAEIERRARLHVLPRIGGLTLDKVTARRLETFYAELAEAGLSSGTVRHIHSDMRQALKMAKRDRWIDYNPADDVILPPMRRKRIQPPDLDLLRQIIEAADTKVRNEGTWPAVELALFVRLAAVTGARLSEVLALRYSDIRNGVVSITRALEEFEGRVTVKGTKTETYRSVPIPLEMVRLIDRHREAVAGHLGDAPADGDMIFLSVDRPLDEPMRPTSMQSRYQRLVRDIERAPRLHDFRHFAVSSWLDVVPILEASALAGHSRTSTTTDVYGHLVKRSDGEKVASILEPVLRRRQASGS